MMKTRSILLTAVPVLLVGILTCPSLQAEPPDGRVYGMGVILSEAPGMTAQVWLGSGRAVDIPMTFDLSEDARSLVLGYLDYILPITGPHEAEGVEWTLRSERLLDDSGWGDDLLTQAVLLKLAEGPLELDHPTAPLAYDASPVGGPL